MKNGDGEQALRTCDMGEAYIEIMVRPRGDTERCSIWQHEPKRL